MTTPVSAGGGSTVLVVTERESDTGDAVTLALQDLSVRVVRFDLADVARRHVVLNAQCRKGRWEGSLTVGARITDLADIRAILWFHPGVPRIRVDGMTPAEARWASGEATAGLAGVLGSLDCLHVNHPADIRRAEVKADVLAAAERCGLAVPPTWIGSDPSSARRFARAAGAGGGVITKALTLPQITEPGSRVRSLYTAQVSVDDLGAVTDGVTQLQHRVRTNYAVRAHTLGTRTVAVRIDAGTAASRTDWRADLESLTYTPTTLPPPVEDALAALARHYRLSYAASDLLVDAAGAWHFVDLNPAGQYRWLEVAQPGLGISRALAVLLAGRNEFLTPAPEVHAD
ncbi:hypothetical protein [Streptomyces sp. NPDC059783]|uniref:hypothetical protein n=1 Tax=Streptomyces sp. NPDC059783 TaxID=3346944 RepID=UPI003667BE9D